MTIHHRRRDNLQLLVTRHGSVQALAEALDRAPSQLSRCLSWPAGSNSRRIGDRLAAHITCTLGLPAGWMDRPQHPTQQHPLIDAACRYIETAPDHQLTAIITALLTTLTTRTP